MMTDTAPIGHNNPPAHIEHEALAKELDEEAKAYFSGVDIPNADAAQDVANFLDRVITARKAAEAGKESEYRPHKDAANAVTAKYKPILSTFDGIEKSAKQAIAAYERKVAEEKAQRERELAAEAERKAEEARKALQESAGDHEARLEAEAMVEDAKTHAIAAKVVAKPERVKVGKRAITMREYVDVAVTEPYDLLKWVWQHHRSEIVEAATRIAEREAKAGKQEIPGIEISRERRAV